MAPWSVIDALDLVAETRADSEDVEEMLVRITRTACDTIPGTDFASVVVRYGDGHLEAFAPTDTAICLADDLQCLGREGPSYDAVTAMEVSYCGDLTDDARWPVYGKEVSALGIRSQLAMRVHEGPRARIGLTLYSRERHAFRHPLIAAEVLIAYADGVLTGLGDLDRIRRAATAATSWSR